MFKHVSRELHALKGGGEVSVAVALDEKGHLDKQCPAPNCGFTFKVNDKDWRRKSRDEDMFCPRCGHQAPAKSWTTKDQIHQAKQQTVASVLARIGGALANDAAEFNDRPRRGVHLSMTITGLPSTQTLLPIEATALLEQVLVCEKCCAEYSVLGPAFFCPCCGDNPVEKLFDAALAKVRTKVAGISAVQEVLRLRLGADNAEVFSRSTIEGAVQDCVVAFQHLAERLYVPPSGTKPPGQNAFQRLDEGSALWRSAIGVGYEDWLEAGEFEQLKLLFQQRHLLAHRDGLVDDKYVQKSGDTTYKSGQRIVVNADHVLTMVALVERLAAGLRAALVP